MLYTILETARGLLADTIIFSLATQDSSKLFLLLFTTAHRNTELKRKTHPPHSCLSRSIQSVNIYLLAPSKRLPRVGRVVGSEYNSKTYRPIAHGTLLPTGVQTSGPCIQIELSIGRVLSLSNNLRGLFLLKVTASNGPCPTIIITLYHPGTKVRGWDGEGTAEVNGNPQELRTGQAPK